MATTLAVFRVSKVLEGGAEVTPEVRFTDALIRYVHHPLADPLSPLMLALQSPGEIQM